MTRVKIISVIVPKTNRIYKSYYDVFVLNVEYENGKKDKMYLSRIGYKAFVLEQTLLKKGIAEKLIEAYGDAKYDCGFESGIESREDYE